MEYAMNVPQAGTLRVVIADAGNEDFLLSITELIEEASSARYPAYPVTLSNHLIMHEALECVGLIAIHDSFIDDAQLKKKWIPEKLQVSITEEIAQSARVELIKNIFKEMSSGESPLQTNTVLVINAKDDVLLQDLIDLLSLEAVAVFPTEEEPVSRYSYAYDFLNSRKIYRRRRAHGNIQ